MVSLHFNYTFHRYNGDDGRLELTRSTRADFAYSSTWSTKPLFPAVPQLSGSLASHEYLSQKNTAEHLKFDFPASNLIRSNVIEIMGCLRVISAAISTPQPEITDRRSIGNAVYSVEHHLLTLQPEVMEANSSQILGLDMSQGLLIAAHLFLHLAIRELPSTAKMHINMLNILKSSIPVEEAGDIRQLSEDTLRLLVWTLFMGAAATSEQSNRTDFVKGLRMVCSVLNVQSYEEFERVLKGVLWLDRFCELHCSTVWDEIML
jgi:hypothetical protein